MDAKPDAIGNELQFGILGPLRITVDGRELVLDSPKQRRLLATLLLDVGRVVSADRLADILWGDDQPADPSGAVQTHVSRLRALLGDEDRRMLVTRPPGYLLAVDPDQIDARRFERLLDEARAASTPEATADLLRSALELWRGSPLAEFEHDVARAEATRLEELRVIAVELRAESLLAMGRYAQLAGELEAAVSRHPLREQLRGLLMVTLVGSGRRADALATYRELRDVLVDELGVEPSPDLRRLERAILQQDEQLPWPAPPHHRDPPSRPHHLDGSSASDRDAIPDSLTSFVGRQADVEGVAAALSEGRLVVLTGVGGVGKSRLAHQVAGEVADEYTDGVRLCDLVPAGDAEAVSDVVATTLGALPADGADTEDALVTFLRAQRLLLVLDNCEHVVDGAAELVDRVVRRCPGVDVLATSRQSLGVAGERVWQVQPLDVGAGLDGPAVSLFRDRATAADPSFSWEHTDQEAVGELCRRLDGLPLALELAAARVRSMTPTDLADRLDHRFELFTGPARATTRRHQSLQAVVDWSYAQLPETTRHLFDRLAVFAGDFGMVAAERVCSSERLPDKEVAGRLAELVDHSLVSVDRSGKRARYQLLETLRAYGQARLDERGELPIWRRRHAEYFVALAEEATAALEGPEEPAWMRRIDVEFANLRTAHAWARTEGDLDLALQLPAQLREYAYYRLRDEVYDWALRAVDLPGANERPAYPAALLTAGIGWLQRGRLDLAHVHAEEVAAIATSDDVVLRARRLLAEVALYQGRLEDTERLGREVVGHARAVDRPYDEALGVLYRVHAAAYSGRATDTTAHLQAGWQVVERAGTPTLRAAYWFLEGEVRLDAEPRAALDALQRSIEIARVSRNRFVEGIARVASASMEARHGQPGDALAAFRTIIDDWRTSGDWAHMWTTLHNLVVLLERVGADRPAAVLLGAIETARTGAPAFGEDAARLAATAASLQASLGDAELPAARERGRSMSDDQAVAYALAEIDGLATEHPPSSPAALR